MRAACCGRQVGEQHRYSCPNRATVPAWYKRWVKFRDGFFEGLDRIVFGPDNPTGMPFMPRRRWRCSLGLHRRVEVWACTIIDSSYDPEAGRVEQTMAVDLAREPDYRECIHCGDLR